MEKKELYVSRYVRNMKSITDEENNRLKKSRILIAGCGGLGGYIADMSLRIGFKYITILDKDKFEVSNLNRQLFCTERNIGNPKALEAVKRLKKIDSTSVLKPLHRELTESNCKSILKGYDLIVDAFDGIPSKLLLEKNCEELDIPLVHGAIAGWTGQICTVFPGDKTLEKVYHKQKAGEESISGVLSFTASITAGYQVSQILKVILNKRGVLRKKLLQINILENYQQIIDFK